jgi:hypothetical protein
VKKGYERPRVVEYGRVDQLTLGQTGGSPDFALINGILTPIGNNDCNPSAPAQNIVCS